MAKEEEPISSLPGLGLPPLFEVPPVWLQIPPAFSCLDHLLELREPLEGHAQGERHAQGVQQGDDFVAKEGAVHPCLDRHTGQVCTDGSNTGQDELLGAIGVMHVSGTMMDIENLPGLSDRTEQGVVAPHPFFPRIMGRSYAVENPV